MRTVAHAFIIITLTIFASTIVPKICLPFDKTSSGTHMGSFLSDSSFHNKGEGFIIPFESTSVLLTQAEITVDPYFWMCQVQNFDFVVDCRFTILNPTKEAITLTLAFPFSTHDIYADHDEQVTFNISEGDSTLSYSVAMNNDLFSVENNMLYFRGREINYPVHSLLEEASDLATIAPALYAEDFELIAYWDMSIGPEETKEINVNFIHYSGFSCCGNKNHFAFDVTNVRFWNAPVDFTGTFLKNLNYESISTSLDIQENEDYFLLTGTDFTQKIEIVVTPPRVELDLSYQQEIIELPQVSTEYVFYIWNHGEETDTIELKASPSLGVVGSVLGYVIPGRVEIPPHYMEQATLFVSGDELTVPGKYEVSITATSQLDPSAFDTATTITSIIDPSLQVTIIPDSADICIGDCQTFTASTTKNGEILTGSYTWELNGRQVGTGDTYEFCPTEEGSNTLLVIDRTNNDRTDWVTITIKDCSCVNPTVTISPNIINLNQVSDSVELCATTTCADGREIDGYYFWDFVGLFLDGALTPKCTTITLNADDDPRILCGIEVRDLNNENIKASTTCSYPKSHWIPLTDLVAISIRDLDLPPLLSKVAFECDADGKGILDSIWTMENIATPDVLDSTIWLPVIKWSAILTGNFFCKTEMCTVFMEDNNGKSCTGEFVLDCLGFFEIPLSE